MTERPQQPGFHATPSDKMGWPGRVSITLDVNANDLKQHTDAHLAAAWHAAQAANAPYGDRIAGELVKNLGFEIIRRWLGGNSAHVQLYNHQADAHDNAVRSAFARYVPGGADDRDGRFHDGVWTLKGTVIDAVLAGPPPGTTCPRCGTDGQTPTGTRTTDKILDRGASGLARIEHGPGAGQTWICRDAEACRTRVRKAAESDHSLTCARCGRLPGVTAAAEDLTQVDGPIDLGGPNSRYGKVNVGADSVCTDRALCDRRIAQGARPPYRLDRDMQDKVAELGAANAVRDGLGPAQCQTCGHDTPADLKSPHIAPDNAGAGLAGKVIGAWRCRDENACRERAAAHHTEDTP